MHRKCVSGKVFVRFMYQIPNSNSPLRPSFVQPKARPTTLTTCTLHMSRAGPSSAPALKSNRRRPPGPAQNPLQAPLHW